MVDISKRLRLAGLGSVDDFDVFLTTRGFDPTFGEYLRAKAGQGFDYTTTRMVADMVRLYNKEAAAYGKETEYQGQYGRALLGLMGETGRELEQRNYEPFTAYKNPARLTTEEYKASGHYREGVKWQDGWTEVHAQVLAERYDLRRYREAVIQNADVGWIGAGLGFGASLVGSLPDPVNLIPFGQGVTGARIGGRAVLTGLKGKLVAGAAEGALGNAATNAFVFPNLIAEGEELGFMDFIADTAAGGVLGVGLSGAGHAVGRGLSKYNAGLNARAAMREVEFNTAIKEVNAAMGADVGAFHAKAITSLKDAGVEYDPITITGTELDLYLGDNWRDIKGLPEDEWKPALRNVQKGVEAYYRQNMQGAKITSPMGEVALTGKGIKKFFNNLSHLKKIMMLPAVKNIIENPVAILEQAPRVKPGGRKDQISRFYRMYGVVELNGEENLVSVIVGQRPNGKLFYDVNIKDADFEKAMSPHSGLAENITRGQNATTLRNIPKNNITPAGDNVNLFTHGPETAKALAARGVDEEKLFVRQTLRGGNKSVAYKMQDKAVADMIDGQSVDVKPMAEQMPAYRNATPEQRKAMFPDEVKPQKDAPVDPKAGDDAAEAYGLEALEDVGRMRNESILTDEEVRLLDAADETVQKAQSVKGAVRNFIGCMFGM